MKRIALIILVLLGLCFHLFGFCSSADDKGDVESLTYLIVGFDDAAKKMIETLKEFKHYDDDEYVNDIQIEIVSGDTRISLK